MKKLILSSLVLCLAGAQFQPAKAGSQEEDIGFISGLVAGAAIGGPVGGLLGAFSGVLIGEQVEKANQYDLTQQQLAQLQQDFQATTNELQIARKAVKEATMEATTSTIGTLTSGLVMDLLFPTNSAELSAQDQHLLRRLAELMAQYPKLSLTLDGYADPRGSQKDNLALSARRADAVKQALERYGVASERIQLTAHGEISVESDVELDQDSYAKMRKVTVAFTLPESPENRVAQQ